MKVKVYLWMNALLEPKLLNPRKTMICWQPNLITSLESHFEIKTNIKETCSLRQPPHILLCKKKLVSITTPLGLEVIPQVKELLDEGLVRKSLNPCALLVPKIGNNRHQI